MTMRHGPFHQRCLYRCRAWELRWGKPARSFQEVSGGPDFQDFYKVYQMNSNQFIFSYSVSRDKVKGLPVYLLLGHSQAAPPEMCLGWEPHWDRG